MHFFLALLPVGTGCLVVLKADLVNQHPALRLVNVVYVSASLWQ